MLRATAGALALLPVSSAGAYDFIITSDEVGLVPNTVVVHTSSVFCFNRMPVANGVPKLNFLGTVNGTTAPGCLIYKVEFIMPNGTTYTWLDGLVGVGSSTFTLTSNYEETVFVTCTTTATGQDC